MSPLVRKQSARPNQVSIGGTALVLNGYRFYVVWSLWRSRPRFDAYKHKPWHWSLHVIQAECGYDLTVPRNCQHSLQLNGWSLYFGPGVGPKHWQLNRQLKYACDTRTITSKWQDETWYASLWLCIDQAGRVQETPIICKVWPWPIVFLSEPLVSLHYNQQVQPRTQGSSMQTFI